LGRRGREPSDAEVNAIVALYPDGAPLPVIATALDVTATRADQVVAEALTKALALAKSRGLIGADCFD
jgi:hypothetical protein